MTTKLFVMCGLINSGKSTKAKELSDKYGAEIVSLDIECGNHFRETGRFLGYDEYALGKVRNLLKSGKSVVYDSLALGKEDRRLILDTCKMDGVKTVCVFMNTPLDVIKQRGYVELPEPLEEPEDNEGFDELIVIK